MTWSIVMCFHQLMAYAVRQYIVQYLDSLNGKCPRISYVKVSDKIACADPDQTAPSGAVWSGSTLFAFH